MEEHYVENVIRRQKIMDIQNKTQREIKFRGWHTQQKVMFSAEEMAKDQLTLLPTGEFINVSNISTKLSTIYPKDKFIPLQFTGLHDKNGKRIYEGDICRIDMRDAFPSCETDYITRVIEFWNGQFVFHARRYEVDYINFGLWVRSNNYETTLKQVEVVGNIYQNPELLEAVK